MNSESTYIPTVWYCVMNPYPTGQKPRVRHETLESAIAEAKRVANLEQKKIHVLRCEGTVYPCIYFDRVSQQIL